MHLVLLLGLVLISCTTAQKEKTFLRLNKKEWVHQNPSRRDFVALTLVRNNSKVKKIVATIYSDPTIKNTIFIDSYPTKDEPEYLIQLAQSQPKINQKIALAFFRLNLTSGKIMVIDNFLDAEKEFTLEEWTKRNKN